MLPGTRCQYWLIGFTLMEARAMRPTQINDVGQRKKMRDKIPRPLLLGRGLCFGIDGGFVMDFTRRRAKLSRLWIGLPNASGSCSSSIMMSFFFEFLDIYSLYRSAQG